MFEGLEKITTNDGSISLRSNHFGENFHSMLGANQEAESKFINPSQLGRFQNKSIKVLDICFGLGYNSSLLFEQIIKQSSLIIWYGLELDKRPLEFALKNKLFDKSFDSKIIKIFNSLLINSYFKDQSFNCKMIWGDARLKIKEIPKSTKFDLIFLDGFSPQKCPEIWTSEFLQELTSKLHNKGYLITYSSAAAVRKTIQDIGLNIYNIKPHKSSKNNWSNGTVAIRNKQAKILDTNSYITELSKMEKEHLQTKAAIPYRDPHGNDNSLSIIKRRNQEQLLSNLWDTNIWRKKWFMTKAASTS